MSTRTIVDLKSSRLMYFQRNHHDLDRLEKWTTKCFMISSKYKYKVQHLGRENLCKDTRGDRHVAGEQLCTEDLHRQQATRELAAFPGSKGG